MPQELRVVIPHLTNQPLVVQEREVWVGPDGCTSPLTEAEHTYLTSIPGFVCASEYDFAANYRQAPDTVVLSDAELGRIRAAGFRLVPIGETNVEAKIESHLGSRELLGEVRRTIDDMIAGAEPGPRFLPNDEDIAEKGDDEAEEEPFEDLFDAWLGMDEAERCAVVGDLEDNGAGETLLIALFDEEANLLNNPKVLAAIDTAISHLRKPTSVDRIATSLVRNSAEGKVKTKNPPHKPRGK